jgi:hypothetical protein
MGYVAQAPEGRSDTCTEVRRGSALEGRCGTHTLKQVWHVRPREGVICAPKGGYGTCTIMQVYRWHRGAAGASEGKSAALHEGRWVLATAPEQRCGTCI